MGYIYKVYTKGRRKIPYFHLYVLKLEHGKYYVGISRNVKRRFSEHKEGKGAEWTKIHKPIKILEDIQLMFCSYTKVKSYEDNKTVELMKRYGRENVRGGIYCAVDQDIVDSILGEALCYDIDTAKKDRSESKKKKVNIYY